MAKEIRFKITNKASFALKYGDYDFSPSGILGKIINLSTVISVVLIIFSLAFENITILQGGTIMYSYYLILILLGLQLIKLIIGQSDFFPSYSFDVQSLFALSFIALSLFVNTVFFKTPQNIWGASGMQSISGITLILYWFMFYVLCLNVGKKGGARLGIQYFNIGVVVGALATIINGGSNVAYFADAAILLIPGMIWLVFTQKKLLWSSILALIITVIMLFWATKYAIFALFIGVAISTILQIILTGKKLLKNTKIFFKNLKSFLVKNITFKEFIGESYSTIILLINLLLVISGVIWCVNNLTQVGTSVLLTNGYSYIVDGMSWNTLIFGRALYVIESTGLYTFVFAYGLLPLLVGIVICVLTLIKLYKFISKTKIRFIQGRFIALISILITLISFFVVSPINNSVMIMIWITLALLAITNELYVNKKVVIVNNAIKKYNDIKEDSIKEFMQILQKLLIILIIVITVYGFSYINSVSEYLIK
jgi:hypothetical protein